MNCLFSGTASERLAHIHHRKQESGELSLLATLRTSLLPLSSLIDHRVVVESRDTVGEDCGSGQVVPLPFEPYLMVPS